MSVNTIRTGEPMPTVCASSLGGQHAVRVRQIPDHPQRFMLRGLPALSVELDEQNEVGDVRLEGRLNARDAPRCRSERSLFLPPASNAHWICAPRAGGGGG